MDSLTQPENSFNAISIQIIIENKEAVIETNEGREGPGADNIKRGLQCIFLSCRGYCCFEATDKGGISDPRQLPLLTPCGYECRMCSDSDAAGVI